MMHYIFLALDMVVKDLPNVIYYLLLTGFFYSHVND